MATGIAKFFEKAEWAKRTMERLRQIIKLAKKFPKPSCLDKSLARTAGTAQMASSLAQSDDFPKIPCLTLLTAGKNFKAHYLSHKSLLEDVLGKNIRNGRTMKVRRSSSTFWR
ncbi:hypothetical protein [Streptomyces sp. NBC_00576]|uniref:hypothetical protein n=1 Tax=Streptomyces sp. NBC_00576 TaxID=2903665 RepID=UPI002E80B855|nr:hypothetical protein [Streptomyces sp. NBC_00576]WUB72231.1 hypothetical protein OG734_20125 [Streptomyces sp. NBC_00576]